jgi:hypothetical protein
VPQEGVWLAWLDWLENGSVAEWVRSSLVGWPLMLSLHSVGMSIMLGLLLLPCFRMLGCFGRLPLTQLRGIFPVGWGAFALNGVAGTALFLSQASIYVFNLPFILK